MYRHSPPSSIRRTARAEFDIRGPAAGAISKAWRIMRLQEKAASGEAASTRT
jgi:hypothetical protein